MLGLLLRFLVKELSVNVLRNTGYGGGVYENESEVKIKRSKMVFEKKQDNILLNLYHVKD